MEGKGHRRYVNRGYNCVAIWLLRVIRYILRTPDPPSRVQGLRLFQPLGFKGFGLSATKANHKLYNSRKAVRYSLVVSLGFHPGWMRCLRPGCYGLVGEFCALRACPPRPSTQLRSC